MINVIFGLSIVLIVFSIIMLITSIYETSEVSIIISVVMLITNISIAFMSDTIRSEPNNFNIINGTAKYNEILYINETDTIKLYDIIRIDKDDKK